MSAHHMQNEARPDRVDTRLLGAHVHKEAHRAFKILAASQGQTSGAMLEKAIADLLKTYKQSVPAVLKKRLKQHGL